MDIEYLKKFRGLLEGSEHCFAMFRERHAMVREYSFAIPTPEAVRTLVGLSPLVEMGAGTGYWAMLISQAGGDILAFDRYPKAGNKYAFTHSYGLVREGDEQILRHLNPQVNLFLCWPNYNTDFAYNCLIEFRGAVLAYIGEEEGGCTGNAKFFGRLRKEWALRKCLDIPQWSGKHDRLFVYERK